MNNKRQKLYDNLIGTGRVSDAEIGTLDEFRSAIKDEKTARQFHKNLLGAGFDEDEIGTEDEFYNSISSDFAENKPKSEPYTHVYGADGSLIGGTAYQGTNMDRPSLKEQVADSNRKFAKMEELPWARPQGGVNGQLSTNDLSVRLNDTYKEGGFEPFMHQKEDESIKAKYTPKKEEKSEDVWQNANNRFKLTDRGNELDEELMNIEEFFRLKYLEEFKNSDEFKAYNSKKYNTQADVDKANKEINDLFNTKYAEVIQKDMQPYYEAYNKELQSRYGNDIENGLQKIARKENVEKINGLKEQLELMQHENAQQAKPNTYSSLSFMPASARVKSNQQFNPEQADKTSNLYATEMLLKDAEAVVNGVDKADGFFSDMFRALGVKVGDVNNWTLGASELLKQTKIGDAFEKAANGEELSRDEQLLLEAYTTNLSAHFFNDKNLSLGYKAGQMTGDSLPLIGEFIFNPLSGAGKVFAKKMLVNALKKGISGNMAKFGGRLAGDALAATGMTLTSGMPSVLAETERRLNEDYDYSFDDNGNLHVSKVGDVSLGGALAKSIATRTIENQSEMIFNAFGKWSPLNRIAKDMGDMLPDGVNGFFNRVRNSKAGQWYREIKNNPTLVEAAERAQFHGLPEEYFEEVYNNFANVALGEMTMDEALDLDKNIETFVGLAPTSVAFGAIGLGGMARERYLSRRNMNRVMASMSEEQKAKFKELQEMGKLNENKDIAEFIKITIADKNLTPEEKRAEIEYAYNLAKQNAINEVAEVETQDRVEADNASIDAATDTQTGNYAQVTAIFSDGAGGTKEVVGNVVGWIGDSPMFVPDGMEVTEENKIPLQPGQWNPETLIARPAEEVKAINEDIIREEVATQSERESKYAPEVLSRKMEQGIPFETADAIYLPIQPMAEGNGWTVEVQPKATNNKTASKSEVIELTNDEFYDLLQADLEAQEAVQAEIAQSESVGEQVNTPVNTEVNNPMENAESTPMSEETQSATEEKSTQPQAEQPKQPTLEEVVATLPKNKKGEIDYKSMTPQQQYQYTSLTESPEVALEDLQADIAAGQEEITKKQEQLSKARGGERAALRDEVRKLTQAQAELQSFYDSVASNVEETTPIEEVTEPTAQEEEQPTEVPTQVEAVEEVVSEEEQRRRPLRERAKEWSDALGVDVTIYESVDDIEDEAVRQQVIAIHNSKKLAPGWVTDGKVYFLMSDMADVDEIDNTYIHEVVAHIGMEKLLGKERFAELCDKVWGMMPQSAKDYFYNYPEVSNIKDDTARRRKAADEYIASLAEKENLTPEEQTIWDSIVKMFRDMLDKALNGIIGKSKLTDKDISDLIKASYANLKSGTEGGATNAEGSRMRAVERIEENVGEVDAKKGDVRFAVRDILKGEERKQAIKDLMEVTGRSKKTVEKWLEAEESLASVILNEDNVGILDMEADESVPSIWKNSDYPQGTVEFSNICKKRLPFTTIYQRLQKEFPNTLFDAQTLNTIRTTMKEMGEDVACALCFVEDRRQLLGEIGQGFIDAVKGMDVELNDNQKAALDKLRESGDKYIPNLFDIITLDGMKELRKKHPAVAQAFVEYNNARGMQSGRLFQAYSAYNREILKYNKKKVEGINNNGGLRIFSFSDFEAHHLIDLVQVLTDCAAKGIKVQGYTKVPEFAKAVKGTNAKINRSLIPKGVGYVDTNYVPKEGEAVSPNVINGKRLLFDTVEGIDVNNPNFFDSTNSKSVGNILVAINDEHARLAMADPFVDYIIGFHTGQSKAILKGKGIDTWVNYKNEQLDKEIVTDEKGNQKMKNAPHHGLNIYTDVLNVAEAEGNPIKTAKQFTERFIEECNKRGWIPRFHRFLNRAKDGRFLYTPGYHKFLIDFKLFDKNGKILPQEAVVPVFDNEFNKQILDDYVKGVKEEMPNDAVYEAVKEAVGLGEGKRFRVTPQQDKDYLEAVNSGNLSKAQQMVDEVLEGAGYTIRGEHGTTHKFTIFSNVNANIENSFGKGFYFTSDIKDAEKNYASDTGADLTNRIELLAERMEYEDGYEDMSYEERKEEATKRLNGGENLIISAAIRMENPCIFSIDPDGVYQETIFEAEEAYNEETDEYSEPEGNLVDFVNSLQNVLDSGEYWGADRVDTYELLSDGYYTADQLKGKMDEMLMDITDEEGNIASSEIFRQALEGMGFDGIIDNAPSHRFKGMGLSRETKHYIAFSPNQIKQSDAVTYDNEGNIIPLSQRADSSNDDIRFRVKSFETANEELDKDEISINNEELMDEYGLSDVTLSKSGNHVTLSKVVVEDKGKGNGTRFMEDLTNNADNNGWILALTPDTSFGGSSVARLKKFYKRFGFKDNKGRNTDFETRESMVRPVGGNRFRISNQNQEIFAHEPAIDYVSQANDIVEVPRDEVMYTMNNIASQLYKTSGRFMRQLYQNGTLGRVLKGDYAEIDQIKAKNEYDHAKPILDEYLNELVWMKYQATDAAQEVINGVISDVEYAIKYYKDLSLGKDVWRTEERPRFRIVEKQREDVNKGVDSFTSKYNSKPVSVASSDMTDEELEKAVPTSLVEDTRKAIEEGVKGKYSVKADKIYIFADNVTKEELEDTLFHENLHPMFSGNPIIEEFYANFNAKYPEQVEMLAEGYEESEVPEEVFVTNLAVGMQRGNFKMVEPFLAESSREELYNTLKAFGYDYEQERGRRNPERNSGKGSDVAEGKKVVDRSRGKENSEGQRESSREQAEKLRDLFGRVADMGLDGVLGNEAYDRAMMDIYSVLPEDSRKEVIDDAFNHYGMNIAPAVSDYIHGKSDGNILDKIVAIIRNALRKAGFNIDLNGNEVKYLAWRSKKPLDRSNLVDMAEDIYKKYQLKVGEYSTNDDGTTPDGGGTRFRRVYHGSSASFDKFDHSFMGTGEGNQSFGWGSYVTDVKEVGEKYAGLKADNSPIASQTLRWLDENPTYEAFITKGEGARRKKTIANAKEFLKEMKEDGASEDVINAYEQDLKDAERAITEDGYNQTKENMVASLNRHLYEVEIPDDNGSNYIAWDKMLPKEQAERIKDAIRNSKFFKEYEKDYKQLAEERLDAWTKTNGGRAYKLLGNIVWNEKDLSQILSEAGFAGFKYPTNYFSGGNEDGSNNYVIFNEDDLKIVEHTRFRVANKLQVRDDYEATIKKSGFQAREAVQDAMLSLRRFQELIEKESGKKLKDFENAWMHENRLSSVVQAAIHEMERKFYKPMMESVKKLMKAADIKQEEVADYLMLKHGIERNREMAVRKALTDAEGKIDRAHLEQWYQDKEAIRNDASLDTWRKKQEAMDNLALSYGADMSRDYSGLTSMFDTDDIEECTNRAYDEVEALENAYPAEIEALGKAVKAMTQNTLDESFRSGLMDRKVYDELSKDMYDYYIPLRGFEETTSEEVYAYLDQDRGAFNAPLQRAKGRSSKSDNPIAYLKSIAESGIMQGERNKMKQTFLNMVINHPSDLVSIHEGVWVVFNPATGEWEAAAPPAIPNNATPADVEAAMEAWEQQMEQAAQNDPTLVKKVSEASDIPYRVVGNRMNQHQIIVKRLGKSYTLTVNGNPRLAMALNGLTNPNNTSNDGKVSAYVSGKFGALNRFLASVYTTKNPDFVVSNFLRDTFYTNTIVRAKEGNSYANKFHKHYAELLMPGKMISLFKKYENGTLDMSNATEAAFKDFMMNGGETGYSNLKDLENIKKQIAKDLKGNRLEVVEKVAEKLDILNRAVENTARFAAYLTSREEGRSIAKSVFDAKEISVNFNKKGAGGTFFGMTGQTKLGNLAAMVGAGGRALYVFFNAAIQGTTNLLHVMKKSPKGTSAGIAAMFLMGAVLPFLLDDDEEKDYYDLPEHVRRNHLILPGFGDAWISIPLPIEYRIMYGMGELLTSWRTGHERGSDIGRKMLNLTGQALPLNFLEEGFDAFIPSSLSPLWQVYNNKSWTGLPLYKDNEFNKDDPEYTKAYKNVDKTLYNVSKALYDWTFDEENQEAGINLNPAVLEALARGYFGGFATQLGNLGKTWETIAGEREFDWRSIPIGNRVFKSGDERTKEKRITNEYFENMEKLDFMQSRERTLKKTINGVSVPQEDKDRAKEDYDKMKDTDIYKKYQEFKKKKKDVDKLRKRMKEKGSTEELEKKLTTAQEEANKVVR